MTESADKEISFDYEKDDVCYGCKFAVRKTEKQMERDGAFARRYLCGNHSRLWQIELDAIADIVSMNYEVALSELNKLVNMTQGCFPLCTCEESGIRPMCYVAQQKERTE